MKFASPEFLWLALLVPIAILYRRWSARQARGGVRFPLAATARAVGTSWRVRLAWLPDLVRVIVFVLLIIGCLRPQYGIEREETVRKGLDIILALDLSGSMAAEDFKPNRVTAAKAITEKFIGGLTDHRLGLVVFAGLSLTQCPLTLDYGVITELLRRADLKTIKVDGTAIGDAIANAVYKFKADGNKRRDRVIIVLTDGENNAGVIDPLEAAKIAAEKKIRIYTIGVGSAEGAPIPMNVPGRPKQYMRNPDGSLYIPRIDEQLLKDVAYLTQGQYFRATDNQALERIYHQIATLERGEIQVGRVTQYSDRFAWYLAPAFALLLFEFYLRSRVWVRVF